MAGESHAGASIGYGYGAKEYWFTEVYLKQERDSEAEIANIAEWENKFQLTDTGEYPVDVGLITELEAPLSARRRRGNSSSARCSRPNSASSS